MKDATSASSQEPQQSKVSIHASVKDATRYEGLPDNVRPVSIHASVKDATSREHGVKGCPRFQSTRP